MKIEGYWVERATKEIIGEGYSKKQLALWIVLCLLTITIIILVGIQSQNPAAATESVKAVLDFISLESKGPEVYQLAYSRGR